ncbi:serine protease inhibitor dipetalogastin-like [Argopecten irradians]|uniref:serine protease inhibitor dipetalogastin-like n=1 Tax=Argopecten irradians TaxID=31199 RepID=UPI0037201982
MNTAMVIILILTYILQIDHIHANSRARCYRKHVCGLNGKTYRNECVASRRGIMIACKKRCPCLQTCNCIKTYRPVCGWNGQTYGNRCLAYCQRVGVRCHWPCPCFTGWN